MQRWVGGRAIPLLVAAASAALLLGAYLSQHVGGLAPCPLCLIQRYPTSPSSGWGSPRPSSPAAGRGWRCSRSAASPFW